MELKKIEIRFERMAKCEFFITEGLQHIKTLPWLSIVQSVEGSYTIQLENREPQKTEAGGFFIAPAQITQDIVHHLDTQTKRMQCRWIFLDVRINDAYPIDMLYDFPTLLPTKQIKEMNRLFDRLAEAEHLCDRMSILYRIVKMLFDIGTPKPFSRNDALLPILQHIHTNYSQKIEIADLASVGHMSKPNLHATFKKQFGISPIAYLNKFRLSMASDMLKQTDLPINEIALRVGIPDPLYFSKIFRKMFRVSPKEYRNTIL